MHRTARARRTAERARALPAVAALVLALVLFSIPSAALADPTEQPAAERAYQAVGPEVSGGGSQAQAPLLVPGLHRDSLDEGAELGEEGSVKFYRVAVGGGQRLHAAATIAAPPYPDGLPREIEGLGVDLEVLTAGGDVCSDGGTDDVGEYSTGDGPITSSIVSDVMGYGGCAGEELFLRVARTGSRAGDQPLPVEIQVAIEPAGIGGGEPAVTEEIEDEGADPVPPEDEEPLEPGRSFGTAAEVAPGSYVLELVPGEVAALRLEVPEGQRLRWRAEVTSQPENPGSLSLGVANAVRDQVTVGGGTWTPSTTTPVTGGGMFAPVDRGNRSSELTSIASAWLPGTHTVLLQRLQLPDDAEPERGEPVTVVLTLALDGEVAEDAPEGSVLELGEPFLPRGPLSGIGLDVSGRELLLLGGAGTLTVLSALLGIAGLLVLRMRRG